MGRKASSLSFWVGVKVFHAHNEFGLVKLYLLPPSSESQFSHRDVKERIERDGRKKEERKKNRKNH